MGAGKKNNKGKEKNIFLNAIIIFLIVGFIFFCLESDIFKLENIIIEGNLKIKKEEIEKESELVKNKNIFKQSFFLAQRKLSKNPRIFKVEIKRKLPNTAVIDIVERKEIYQISRAEGYYILDDNGLVLRKESVKQNLITLKGIEGDLEINEKIDETNFFALEEINKIYQMIVSLNFDTAVTAIDVKNIKNKDIIIELEGEKKNIFIKQGIDLRVPMLMVKEILEKEKGKIGDIIIPVDNPIYFREKI